MSAPTRITTLEARDIRFPTSRWLDGSDAMHTDPDYSAAYVVLRTTADDGIEGHGLTFTSGRGTEVCVAAARALEPLVVGRTLEGIVADMSGFWRSLVSDTQLRWLGPEKGVVHLATAAVVNAVWDLWAKREGKPVWKLLCDLSPEELVGCVDFRYIEDALSREEALDLLRDARRGAAAREAEIVASGYPAYTTSAGWLGYSDDKVEARVREALAAGFTPRQDEGRRRHRVGRPPRRPDPPRARARRRPDDGREPGLGRRRGAGRDGAACRPRAVVDRGADEPRRRAGPRADPPRDRADPCRDRRARPESRHLQAALPGARRSTSARSTRAGSAA